MFVWGFVETVLCLHALGNTTGSPAEVINNDPDTKQYLKRLAFVEKCIENIRKPDGCPMSYSLKLRKTRQNQTPPICSILLLPKCIQMWPAEVRLRAQLLRLGGAGDDPRLGHLGAHLHGRHGSLPVSWWSEMGGNYKTERYNHLKHTTIDGCSMLFIIFFSFLDIWVKLFQSWSAHFPWWFIWWFMAAIHAKSPRACGRQIWLLLQRAVSESWQFGTKIARSTAWRCITHCELQAMHELDRMLQLSRMAFQS